MSLSTETTASTETAYIGQSSRSLGKVMFTAGRVVATPASLEALHSVGYSAFQLVHRHQCGEWSGMCPGDRFENLEALRYGEDIFSFFRIGDYTFYLITTGDRSLTTLLLKEEY